MYRRCDFRAIRDAGTALRAFTRDPVLLREGAGLMHVAALFLIMDAGNVVARGVLRGTGDVMFAAVVGIVSAWCMTPPLTWPLGYHLGLGVQGAWPGLCAEIGLGTAILWWRLVRGGWRMAAQRSRAAMDAHARPAAPEVATPGT